MLINVILSTYLQYADHTDLAILHIGVKGRRKEEKKRAVPRAAAAYGRQLKIITVQNTMLEIKKKCSLNITLLNVLPYEL